MAIIRILEWHGVPFNEPLINQLWLVKEGFTVILDDNETIKVDNSK